MINLYKYLLSIQGYPLNKAVRHLNERTALGSEEFFNYQQDVSLQIFEFHKKNNDWYKKFIKGSEINGWKDIPIIGKGDIQLPLSQIMTQEFIGKSTYRNNTSGSTGKPFHFVKDKYTHASTWAYIFYCYERFGIEYGKSLQARFFGIPLSRKKYLKEKTKDYIAARVRFPIFDLSDKVLSKYLRKFTKHRFDYIYGYTSSLVLFAKYIFSTGKSLVEICPTLKYCIVTSEVCSSIDEEILQRGFGVKVINEYGAAELDIISFSDVDGNRILNEENLLVEILDEENNQVPDGEVGRVVVTSLFNKAMPFIRYDLGDRASILDKKINGRRVISSLDGRKNDVAILPSGKKSPGLTFYYVSKSLLEDGGFIKEFVIKQLAVDHFHFEYVAQGELTESQKDKIMELMDQYLEPNLKASFERLESIQRTDAGKFKHFQNLYKERN